MKLIASFGMGYDTIDEPTCQKAGILLTIASDGVRRPVAVSAITFMLMLAHKVGIKDRLTRSGRWAEKSDHIGTGLAESAFRAVVDVMQGKKPAHIVIA